MELVLEELATPIPNLRELVRTMIRLLAAIAVGALIGHQRERMGKAAGLRTHLLLSMGTTLLVVSALEFGMENDGISRVIQGLVTGIGIGMIAGILAWVVLGVLHRMAPEQTAGPPHGNG